MKKFTASDTNVSKYELLPTPNDIRKLSPGTERTLSLIEKSRQELCNIIDEKDSRILLVVGPCSIHDTEAGLDYAKRLLSLSEKVQDKFLILAVLMINDKVVKVNLGILSHFPTIIRASAVES